MVLLGLFANNAYGDNKLPGVSCKDQVAAEISGTPFTIIRPDNRFPDRDIPFDFMQVDGGVMMKLKPGKKTWETDAANNRYALVVHAAAFSEYVPKDILNYLGVKAVDDDAFFFPNTDILVQRFNRLLEEAGSSGRVYLQKDGHHPAEYIRRTRNLEMAFADMLKFPLHFIHDFNFHGIFLMMRSPRLMKLQQKAFDLERRKMSYFDELFESLLPKGLPADVRDRAIAAFSKEQQKTLIRALDNTFGVSINVGIYSLEWVLSTRLETFAEIQKPIRAANFEFDGIFSNHLEAVRERVNGLQALKNDPDLNWVLWEDLVPDDFNQEIAALRMEFFGPGAQDRFIDEGIDQLEAVLNTARRLQAH